MGELVGLFATVRSADQFSPGMGNGGTLELAVDDYILRETWHAFAARTPISILSETFQSEFKDCVIDALTIRSTFSSNKVFVRMDFSYGSLVRMPGSWAGNASDSFMAWDDIELEMTPEPQADVCDMSVMARWSSLFQKPQVEGMMFFEDAQPPVTIHDEFALRLAFGSAVEFKVKKAIWAGRASYAPEKLSRGDWEVA
jgi:hypothetical protein